MLSCYKQPNFCSTVREPCGPEDRRWQLAVAEVASEAELAMAEVWERIEQRARDERHGAAAADDG